jgi:DNA-binding transcriptional ArsR family regulator
MAYGEKLAALADPTRRELFERLRRGPQTVGALAEKVPVSRPAVSQHLAVLKEAGLVEDEPQGTARIYRIRAEGLAELRRWLDGLWDEALERFKRKAEGEHARRRRTRTRRQDA